MMTAAAASRPARPGAGRTRARAVTAVLVLAFLGVAGQLVRLALQGQRELLISAARPVTRNDARPGIVDRQGRLVATDVKAPSLYADPSIMLDRDEAAEKLGLIFPDLDQAALRRDFADRARRFVWIKRALAPAVAQRVHDLGLPGLAFRDELRRAYPGGRLAGHILGAVNAARKGIAGLERALDERDETEPADGARSGEPPPPLRLSIDLGVQHSLDEELRAAGRRYRAAGAAGLVMDAATGEILASVSLPEADPARPAVKPAEAELNKISGGIYELGSIWKMFTIAMALDSGQAALDTVIDVRAPLAFGRFAIADFHPAGRPLSVAEIFLHSSNVGAGRLGLAAGAERQREFLGRLGLLDPVATEAGGTPRPRIPPRWGALETVTISYGHGIAAAPLQVAAAAAALVNGGTRVRPTFLKREPGSAPEGPRVISGATSALVRDLMRRNVTDPEGTGRRADAPGYRVGGKTGTAEIARGGGYQKSSVISSFLAAFPMDAPRYVALVMIFEPKRMAETGGEVTAGVVAAPVARRVIERVAPLLGVAPAP